MPVRVTVCVGSSCHIKGSRAVIKRFAELIRENGLEKEVILAGCFCMDRCGEGMNWKIDDEDISSTSVEEAEAEFRSRLIETVERPASGEPA